MHVYAAQDMQSQYELNTTRLLFPTRRFCTSGTCWNSWNHPVLCLGARTPTHHICDILFSTRRWRTEKCTSAELPGKNALLIPKGKTSHTKESPPHSTSGMQQHLQCQYRLQRRGNHNVSRDLYDGKPIDSCLLFFRRLCSCQTCPDCHPAGVAAAVLEEPPAESQRERCRVNVFSPILSNIVIVHDRTFLLQHLMWGMHATLVAFTCFYTCFLCPDACQANIDPAFGTTAKLRGNQHDLPKSHWKKMMTNHMTCQKIWNKSSTIGTNGQCWAKSGNQTKLESMSS